MAARDKHSSKTIINNEFETFGVFHENGLRPWQDQPKVFLISCMNVLRIREKPLVVICLQLVSKQKFHFISIARNHLTNYFVLMQIYLFFATI